MSTNNQLPPDFSWVKERAACSVAEVFKQLQLDAEKDVEAANAVFGLNGVLEFRVTSNTPGDIIVVFREEHPSYEVRFCREVNGIRIKRTKEADMVVTLTLNNEGRCKLKVNGEEELLDQWQVRRMALENLFFGEGTTPLTWVDRAMRRI